MTRARERQRGEARTAKVRGEAGNISMLRRRQVTPRWVDNPVQRHNERLWRGCWGRRGLPPLPPGRTLDNGKGGQEGTRINT